MVDGTVPTSVTFFSPPLNGGAGEETGTEVEEMGVTMPVPLYWGRGAAGGGPLGGAAAFPPTLVPGRSPFVGADSRAFLGGFKSPVVCEVDVIRAEGQACKASSWAFTDVRAVGQTFPFQASMIRELFLCSYVSSGCWPAWAIPELSPKGIGNTLADDSSVNLIGNILALLLRPYTEGGFQSVFSWSMSSDNPKMLRRLADIVIGRTSYSMLKSSESSSLDW